MRNSILVFSFLLASISLFFTSGANGQINTDASVTAASTSSTVIDNQDGGWTFHHDRGGTQPMKNIVVSVSFFGSPPLSSCETDSLGGSSTGERFFN